MPNTNDELPGENQEEQLPIDNAMQDAAPEPAPNVQAAEPKKVDPGSIAKDEAIHNAFMLGWQIVELKSRIQLAYDSCVGLNIKHEIADDAPSTNTNGLNFNIIDASIWRSIINKVAGLQKKAFIVNPVAETLYEPPSEKVLPYLYPPTPDYANVGIPGKDSEGLVILENFTLYDVTRRAINCLTLLYLNAEEALIPDKITRYQNRLIGWIRKAAENSGAGGGAIPSESNMSSKLEGEDDPNLWNTPVNLTDKQEAIAALTERTIKFLEAWDGYLRENYYMGGRIENDDAELLGYEAGHSMSSLSWGVSLATIQFEKQSDQTPSLAEVKEVMAGWKQVFREPAVIRLQHQITALSAELDEAYYQKPENAERRQKDAATAMPNPDLPSQAIQAVKKSIDYWQRTIKYISEQENTTGFRSGVSSWNKSMRLALIEQANVWQTLMTGQQSLQAFGIESLTRKLMYDISQEIQANLRNNFKGTLQQAGNAVKEMAHEVKEAGSVAINGIEQVIKQYKAYFIPAVILLLLIVGAFVVYALKVDNSGMAPAGGALISSAVSSILGALGLRNLSKEKEEQKSKIQQAQNKLPLQEAAVTQSMEKENLLSKVQHIGEEAGKVLLNTIEKGYEQIKVELAGLNRSAAVAYPLIEFFSVTFVLEKEADLLTQIIWSGKEKSEELDRIINAAFGSLAVLIQPGKIGLQNTVVV